MYVRQVESCPPTVIFHLTDQTLCVREMLLITQSPHQPQGHLTIIKVSVEIKEMGLYRRPMAFKGRTCTNIRHALIHPFPVANLDNHSIHTTAWYQLALVPRQQVSRRKTKPSAYLFPMNHPTCDYIRTSQASCSLFDITILQQPTYQ